MPSSFNRKVPSQDSTLFTDQFKQDQVRNMIIGRSGWLLEGLLKDNVQEQVLLSRKTQCRLHYKDTVVGKKVRQTQRIKIVTKESSCPA